MTKICEICGTIDGTTLDQFQENSSRSYIKVVCKGGMKFGL
ncbi:hypothetical protein [Tepidibacillus sp. HK-1]|nr:hypothetical protein [Tepidibacillus sp. HK-1]